MYLYVITFIVSVLVWYFITLIKRHRLRNFECLKGKHVMVTGGSSGIGKEVAKFVAKKGAIVSILARNPALLDEASSEIQRIMLECGTQRVQTYSIDISTDYDTVESVVRKAVSEMGPVDMLVNCAGTSVSYRFEDTPIDDFQRMLSVNYLGTVHVTRSVLPFMKEQKDGKIVIVSSLAGILGLYGYTAYSASKFALVGFAEALQMEVKPYNIKVTVALPPDTDTPGFKEEEKTKPIETRKISESAGLFSPEQVAAQMVEDSLLGNFTSVVGMESMFLVTLCSGMMPVSSALKLALEVMTMGIFRIVAAVFLFSANRTVKQCAVERESGKKVA